MKTRNQSMDLLKAIAIVAVVLYHMGVMKYGYLGVDVFLVLGGFFLTKSVTKRIETLGKEGRKEAPRKSRIFTALFGDFVKRILRLYPCLIIACAFSILLGFFILLPRYITDLAGNTVGTLTFSNNIISAITTKNYWDVNNELKPLMHTWYLGVLVQFYVLYYFMVAVSSLGGNEKKRGKILSAFVVLGTIASFILYLCPLFETYQKFYLIPFRFYELGIGCLCAYIKCPDFKRRNFWAYVALTVLCVLLACSIEFCNAQTRLLLVVACVAASTVFCNSDERGFGALARPEICAIGKASYSVFIWHQIILAFYRSFFGSEFSAGSYISLALLIGVFPTISYLLVEKKLANVVNNRVKTSVVASAVVVAVLFGFSYLAVSRSGYFKEYPELEVFADTPLKRHMNGEYVERIYAWNRDFEDDGKIKVLIVGDSFARDWANVLLESKYCDKVDISYSPEWTEGLTNRIKKSDFVFYAVCAGKSKSRIPEFFWKTVPSETRVYGVGTKRFGRNNNAIYNRRFFANYLQQRTFVGDEYTMYNRDMREEWGDAYIDMIAAVQDEDGSVPVFTDDGKFISQDARHLTRAGAEYYGRVLDLDKIFQKQ